VEDIDREIAQKVDLIIDCGETKNKIPNTILDLTKTPWKIVREGRITKEEIIKVI